VSGRRRYLRSLPGLAVLLLALPLRAADLQVAVATNFKTTVETLQARFEADSGHRLRLSTGSTGKLYAQILNGAPFDLFLAADRAHPARLEARGLASPGSRFTYAIGRIVLWEPGAAAVGPGRLRDGAYRRLAIANPALAPYGAAARQLLQALDADAVAAPKLVLGENVGQAFAFVHTRNAELGIVALSQLLTLPQQARGAYWLPPPQLYEPLRQDAVRLRRADDNTTAAAFMTFLRSAPARTVVERAGYDWPHHAPDQADR
jgi:molybdate transport system substrate-binding protein